MRLSPMACRARLHDLRRSPSPYCYDGVPCVDGLAMDTPEQITVYNFWAMGDTAESRALSTSKAPRDVIVNALKAEVVPGTGQTVLRSELDRHGHYRRKATGWGALA